MYVDILQAHCIEQVLIVVILVNLLMEVLLLVTHLLKVLPPINVTLDLDWRVMQNEYVKKMVHGMEQFLFVNVSIPTHFMIHYRNY